MVIPFRDLRFRFSDTLRRFSKNLNLELPVLKVLGGASISDLAEEATRRLLPTAIPLVHAAGSEMDGSVTAPKATGAASEASLLPHDVALNGDTRMNGEPKGNEEPKLNGKLESL